LGLLGGHERAVDQVDGVLGVEQLLDGDGDLIAGQAAVFAAERIAKDGDAVPELRGL